MNKYRARKTTVDGITFDSKGEARRYAELKLMERAGVIANLELQPAYVLQEAFRCPWNGAQRAIKYVADFRYAEGGKTIVEDFKGKETEVYRIKRKMFLKRYPEIVFRVTR